MTKKDIEKINVYLENEEEGYVTLYSEISKLEIGKSSIAKILLETFESELGSLEYERIRIDSNDFEKIISSLKNNSLAIAINDLIKELELFLNYKVEDKASFVFEFIF